MRKITIWIFALIFIVYAITVNAWTNCTPSACSSGYTDNGVYICTGGTCYRNCTVLMCDINSWTQVSSYTFGWTNNQDVEESQSSSGYTPTDSSKCYNFTYAGPESSRTYIRMDVDEPPTDCDSQAIGGFWDTTNKANPWFSGVAYYVGYVDDPEYDYLLKVMRASAESSDDDAYRDDASIKDSISCAPNTIACIELGYPSYCDLDCYNRTTIEHVHQGYYNETGNNDQTLYDDIECGDNSGGATDYVEMNRMLNVEYYVYETNANITQHEDKTCSRTNEAPTAPGVKVIPENPTTDHDLICNYTYSDPEDFEEKNTTYEWWKNSVNQNIDNQILGKENLSVNDQWYCKVTPSDGLTYGTKVQSSNTVTIATTVQNLKMYVNTSQSWTQTGYYSDSGFIYNFEDELQNAIDNCNEDAQGYCNISITFSSDLTGVLNLSNLELFYEEIKQPTGDTFTLSHGGVNISIFDSAGNLFLKNTLIQSSNPQDTADDEFLLRDDFDVVVAKINSTGYMEIKGTLSQNQGTLTNPPGDDFLIKDDNGDVVARINESGYMFLKGSLYENSIS